MKVIFLIVSFFSTLCFSEIKPLMQDLFILTNKIQPYVVDKEKFMDKKNSNDIAEILKNFSLKAMELKNDKMTQADDMKFRIQQLSDGFTETEESFRNGAKDYSLWALKSTFNNCYSCHTQKNLPATTFEPSSSAHISDFAKAEYLFLIRNYSEALPIYERLLSEYPKNKLTSENLKLCLNKLLYYSIRISRGDTQVVGIFEMILKNKKLPTMDRDNILSWQNYLKVKKYKIAEEFVVKDVKKLEEFMKQREEMTAHFEFSEQKMIVDLETSHALFKMMERVKDIELKPWILYYSAQIEKNYRASMFDNTTDMYLKECMESYSKTKAAQKCFKLYKEIKIDSFTGSRGTDLSNSVDREIKKYEKLVQ